MSDWETPDNLFAELSNRYGPFDLDVAATEDNAKARKFFTKDDDGLRQQWSGRVWCNPPYARSEIGAWVAKCYRSRNFCDVIVALLPVRTDTKWFHSWIYHKAKIEFVAGRVIFNGRSIGRPNFASMVTIWRPDRFSAAHQTNLFEDANVINQTL